MRKVRTQSRLFGASLLVLASWSGAATAQTVGSDEGTSAEASEPQVEAVEEEASVGNDIVVTGSRVQANGFQQPTPVSVIGEAELERENPVAISDYLNLQPSFAASANSRNPGVGVSGGGLSLLNLRGLGSSRTLVLLDNRRVVSSSVSGGVDTNTLPTTLVKRVEVVTGGASAAWGADAVAGVVNFVLDTDYSGIELSALKGITDRGDNPSTKLDITAGTGFAGGRGHIVAAATYANSPQILRSRDRDFFRGLAVVNNPAFNAGSGVPRLITVPGAAFAGLTAGGVVASGVLRGTQFLGPTATPAPFSFGTTSTLVQYGGGSEDNSIADNRNLTNALKYVNAFAHVRFDLNDALTAYAEGSYGRSVVQTDSLFFTRSGNLTVQRTNPFLNPALAATLLQAGQTSFTLNKIFADTGPPGSRNERELKRGVLGLEGRIGADFKWNAYYQRGEVSALTETFNNPLIPRYSLAIDAVRDPATGAIVCRSTITNPGDGCVPYNVFGVGAASPEAIAYVFGTVPFQRTDFTEDFVSFDITGPIFSLPAGPVSAALGMDASWQRAVSTQDEASQLRQYATGNFQPFEGEVSFKEVFGELVVPLVYNTPLLQRLELNAAGRLTDYSTSGTEFTWKVGLSNEVTEDLRVRATRSRDIRAPSLADQFTQGRTGTQQVLDPLTNRPTTFLANTVGNPNVKPEKADTTTFGLVYTPDWLSGLGMSIDYYDIKVKGAIATLTSLQTVSRCFAGEEALCDNIIRDSTQTITQINLLPTNIAALNARGIDAELSYRRNFGDTTLSTRAVATYQWKLDEVDANGTTQRHAGAIAEDFPGSPKFKALLSATVENGPFTFTPQLRIIGAAKLRNEWVEGVDIDENNVPATAYLDLRSSVTTSLGDGPELEIALAVDNVLDTAPRSVPVTPGTVPYPIVAPGTRLDLYDAIGRSYRLTARVKF